MSEILPNVLVVDDCQNICNALKRLFQLNGCEFYEATSGRDGLVILENDGPFDVVIADYFMPHMDGVAFLKEANRLWPETFCILLTAFPECHDIEQAVEQGLAAAIMAKPWNDEILVQAFWQAVDLRQSKSLDVTAAAQERVALERRITVAQRMREPQEFHRNCWEYMGCGREPGGNRVAESGICKATIRIPGFRGNGANGGSAFGRVCWTVAGTFCGGEVQGIFAQKHQNCLKCAFYQDVHNLKT